MADDADTIRIRKICNDAVVRLCFGMVIVSTNAPPERYAGEQVKLERKRPAPRSPTG